MARRTPVYLERGSRRTFACAVEWPGWCRVARGDEAALQMLADYAPRYARVAARAGLTAPSPRLADLDVVETVAGTQATDFGAPGTVAACDREPVDRRAATRLVALLDASWAELDAAAAASPAVLRKGPRGGGRDRDAMVAHVVDAERSYARKIGVNLTAAEWREGGVALMRQRIREALQRPSGGAPPVDRGWPPRYLVRRMAWHVLDHAWEMEDRGNGVTTRVSESRRPSGRGG